MNLQTRLFLTIGFVLFFTFVGLEALTYKRVKEESVQNTLHLAEQIRNVLMATRRVYHHQFLDSGVTLTPKTLGFLPAHAMSRISSDFSEWSDSGLSFRNVSDRPRNPDNVADEIEAAAIRYFRENPKEKLRFVEFSAIGGEPFYHYTRPIWVEEYCLKCHGKREDAPETIRETYSTSYNYRPGELRGVMSIKIPMTDLNRQLLATFLQDSTIHLLTFCVMFILLWLTVRRFVTRPLDELNRGMVAIASGDINQKIVGLDGDFANIGHAFNKMSHEIIQNQSAILEGKEQFQAIFDHAPVMINSFDSAGRCLLWNRECERLIGWSRDEVVATPDPLELVYPERAKRLEVLKSIADSCGTFDEFEPVTKDGSIRSQLWASFRLPSGDNIAVGYDITERKLADEQLIVAKESAEVANRAKSEFLAIMSHEIRTPLNAILGMVEVIRETGLDPKQSRYVKIVDRAGNNLLTLIEDILDLSQVESGRLVLEKNSIDLHGLLWDALEIHKHNADRKGVALTSIVDSGTPEQFDGDQKRMRQVLLNLIGNAIKFTDSGRVQLQASYLDQALLFSVSDTGSGIPRDKWELIFEPFSQADSTMTRRHGGVGLGLSLSKRLVEAMDGKIWVESEVGSGSTFYLSIPFTANESSDEYNADKFIPVPGRELEGNIRSILLVEDDSDNAMLIQMFIKNTPHHLDILEDGSQAVERICAGSAGIRQMTFEYKLLFTPLLGLGLRPSGEVF